MPAFRISLRNDGAFFLMRPHEGDLSDSYSVKANKIGSLI
jgi:hypothetical protein